MKSELQSAGPDLWPCSSCPPPRWVCWVRWSWCRVWRWPWPMWLDLGNTGRSRWKKKKKNTVRKTHRNKQKRKKEGATGSHTTHNNNNRDGDDSQNGGWRRKNRQSTAEKRLQKSALTPREHCDLAMGRQTWVKYYLPINMSFLLSFWELSLPDWSAEWAHFEFFLKWLIKMNCSKYLQICFGPGKPRVEKKNHAVMSFYWDTFSVLSRSADVQ